MIILLPFLPPSINQAYYTDFKSRTRHKSKAYRDFKNVMAYYIPKGIKEPITGDIEVEYNFYFPDKRKRDVFNLEKVLTDCLVYYGLFKDDTQIVRGVVEKYYTKGKSETIIEIKPIDIFPPLC